jgi:hypothetical protein
MTVSLQGFGEITHVIDESGDAVNSGRGTSHVAQFP